MISNSRLSELNKQIHELIRKIDTLPADDLTEASQLTDQLISLYLKKDELNSMLSASKREWQQKLEGGDS